MLDNTVLLMDNCAAHKNAIAQKMMMKIKFLFNAPHTPEFNPIEYIFNTLKAEVREKLVYSREELIIRIIQKIRLIKPENCHSTYLHCIKRYLNFA